MSHSVDLILLLLEYRGCSSLVLLIDVILLSPGQPQALSMLVVNAVQWI
jgi:hypothetical protein